MKQQLECIADARVVRAVAFIRENYPRPGLTVHEIAAAAGLSPYHFSRIFRTVTGRSPHDYVLELRLDEARRLLSRGCRSIESIASACGYSSHAHFTNSFGRHVGCTPATYRAQQRALGSQANPVLVPGCAARRTGELSTA